MTPYYEDNMVTIYHADCRDVLPELDCETIITDPTWPNASADLCGKDDPEGMFSSILSVVRPATIRLGVHLGCDSDPRFLRAVPDRLAFFRAAWLEIVRPHYKGRLLYGSDVAYLFGDPPASRQGKHVIPGRTISTDSNGKEAPHPCPRKMSHALWLVNWWSEEIDTILDPCMGSGTTLKAARRLCRKSIGIEIEEKYCEIAARRVQQMSLFETCQ